MLQMMVQNSQKTQIYSFYLSRLQVLCELPAKRFGVENRFSKLDKYSLVDQLLLYETGNADAHPIENQFLQHSRQYQNDMSEPRCHGESQTSRQATYWFLQPSLSLLGLGLVVQATNDKLQYLTLERIYASSNFGARVETDTKTVTYVVALMEMNRPNIVLYKVSPFCIQYRKWALTSIDSH